MFDDRTGSVVKLGKFKLGRKKAGITRAKFGRAEVIKDQKDLPPFFIRGIKAASKEEYWVSLALTRIEEYSGLGWEYQVPIYGGRTRSGGNVVDFIVYTPGRDTWLDPMAAYYHTGRNEDRDQMANAARRRGANLIAWFTDETPTKEIMYTFLRSKLGV